MEFEFFKKNKIIKKKKISIINLFYIIELLN